MQKLQGSIDIKAPAQRVYEFVAQPKNLPGVWPSMVEVSNVTAGTGGAGDFDWVYKMAGVYLKGHTKVTDAQPGKLLVTQTEGAIQSTFRWTFQTLDASTSRLTCDVEYTIPVPVLGKAAEALVSKLNKREQEITLSNIRDVMEHGAAAGVPVEARPH